MPPLETEEDAEYENVTDPQQQQREVLIDDASADESLDFFMPPKKIYYRHGDIDLHAGVDEAKEAEMHEARKRPHEVVVEETIGRPASATFKDNDDDDDNSEGHRREGAIDSCIDGISASLQVAISPKGHVETYPEPFHQVGDYRKDDGFGGNYYIRGIDGQQ